MSNSLPWPSRPRPNRRPNRDARAARSGAKGCRHARSTPLLLSTIDGFSKRNRAAKAAFSMLEALVARLENLVEDELNGGKLSPFTVRRTEPSQCVARLHLAF